MDVLSYSRVPFTQSAYQLLTLSDSQHQFHGFGSAHASVCVFQALQQACGGGWYAEGEKGHALKHISILVCISSDQRNKIIEQCVVLLGFFAYDSVTGCCITKARGRQTSANRKVAYIHNHRYKYHKKTQPGLVEEIIKCLFSLNSSQRLG